MTKVKKTSGRPPIGSEAMIAITVRMSRDDVDAADAHPDGRSAAVREAMAMWRKGKRGKR